MNRKHSRLRSACLLLLVFEFSGCATTEFNDAIDSIYRQFKSTPPWRKTPPPTRSVHHDSVPLETSSSSSARTTQPTAPIPKQAAKRTKPEPISVPRENAGTNQVEEILREAEVACDNMDWTLAEERALEVPHMPGSSPDQNARAYLLAGAAAYVQGNTGDAFIYFRKAAHSLPENAYAKEKLTDEMFELYEQVRHEARK